MSEPRRVKSAQRVAQILEIVASAPDGLQLADVARALGIPRSSAHALLLDMTRSRLLEVKPDSEPPRYQVGLLAFEVGSAFLRQRSLSDEARTIVERLAVACDENAHLAILDGTDVIYVAKAESTSAMRVASHVGLRVPAHATAVGKVLLAAKGPSEVIDLYRAEPPRALTARTVTKLDELLTELRAVAAQGWAFDDEESTPGLQCLAVPVQDATGACVAGLSVSIPTMRMIQIDRDALLATISEHGEALSMRLGGNRRRRRAASRA